MNRIVSCLATAGLIALSITREADAIDGQLDPTFGVGGRQHVLVAMEGFGNTFFDGRAFVQDSAGRIYLIAGTEDTSVLTIVRLHHDGSLDLSYGLQGSVVVPLPLDIERVWSAVMQPDGRIVVGFADNDSTALTSCRVLRSGALDPGYGDANTPGCSEVGPGVSNVYAMAVQLDGHIVLAGQNDLEINSRGVVARLTSTGKLDEGFGDNGVVVLENDGRSGLYDVALAPDGDLILAGDISTSQSDFLVLRLDGTTGQSVPEFGFFGTVVADFEAGSNNTAHAVHVLPDGGLIAAGFTDTNDPPEGGRPAALKLTAAGIPDESFGPGGKRVYDPCVGYTLGCKVGIRDIAVLSGERLALAGWIRNHESSNVDFIAMRLLANGEPDPIFGNDAQAPGTVLVPFDLGTQVHKESNQDAARWVVPEGERFLLLGSARVATGDPEHPFPYRDEFALARLDHGLEASFQVAPKPGLHGALSPASVQDIGHSNRVEFVVLPDPGHIFNRIEKGPGYCDGGMDGDIFVSAPVTQPCEVHVSFKRLQVFADSYE